MKHRGGLGGGRGGGGWHMMILDYFTNDKLRRYGRRQTAWRHASRKLGLPHIWSEWDLNTKRWRIKSLITRTLNHLTTSTAGKYAGHQQKRFSFTVQSNVQCNSIHTILNMSNFYNSCNCLNLVIKTVHGQSICSNMEVKQNWSFFTTETDVWYACPTYHIYTVMFR